MTTLFDTRDLTALPRALFELAVARRRLGHTLWTIETDRNTTAALGTLSRLGALHVKRGIVQDTALVSIPDDVWSQYLRHSPATRDYVPPILGGPM